MIQSIHERYGLNPTNVIRTVTDNASNFAKAFKEFGLDTIATGDPNVNIDAESENIEEPFEEFDIQDVENDVTFEPIDPYAMSQAIDDTMFELPLQERCKSHSISLVATTDIKKAKLPEHVKKIQESAFKKVTKLWNKAHRPKSAEIIERIFLKQLSTPCITRWNSLYDALVCLLAYKLEEINKALTELELERLRETEYEFLKEYVKVLAPLAINIDKCQRENNSYYGLAIPILRQLKLDLLKVKNSQPKYTLPIVKAALEGVDRRFGAYIEQDVSVVKDALIATISHPQFKMALIKEENREFLKQCFISEAENLNSTELSEGDDQPERDSHFDWPEDQSTQGGNSNQNKVSIEVLQFLDDPGTKLEILHKYPFVKKVFLKFNTPLIASAPVERLFSFGSIIIGGRRGRLTDDNFEKLCIMKANGTNM